MTKAEFEKLIEATYAQIRATLNAWDELEPGTYEAEADFDIAEAVVMLQAAIGDSDLLDEQLDSVLASHQFN